MIKNFLLFIILCLLFQPIVEINCHMLPYPNRQFAKADTATLIGDKLYLLGGSIASGRDFYYLDFSVKFNTQKLLWMDLLNIYTVPILWGATSVKGGANNDTLFLYGGYSYDNATSLVHTYEPQNNIWNAPKIDGNNTIRKRNMMGVVDYNGKMYLWGGLTGPIDEATRKFDGHMFILDTINLNWGVGSLVDAPIPRILYGATLLPNQKIIYIGGRNALGAVAKLNNVHFYDTVNDNWSKIATSGNIPSKRFHFSTILGLDGQKVIIFGGLSPPITKLLSPAESLYELDLNSMEWSTPKISGQIPVNRYGHNANVIGKYMVVSFGYGYNQSTESDILLLDISNNNEYVWTDEFIPSTKLPNHHPVLIGTIVGSICAILLGIGSLVLYKWNKNKRNQKKVNPVLENGEGKNHKNENLESKRNEGKKGILPINEREILPIQIPKNAIIKKENNEQVSSPVTLTDK